MLIIIAAAVLALPALPEGPARMAGWATVVVTTAVSVWLLKPTPRRRRR